MSIVCVNNWVCTSSDYKKHVLHNVLQCVDDYRVRLIVCVLCDRDHLVGVSSAKPRPSSEVLDISKREAVMVSAVECVRSVERERRERRERRKENRAELVKQLEEAELAERKEKSKASVSVHTLCFEYVFIYMYGGIDYV